MKHKAFNLVEVIVVLAILAGLAAILLSVFWRRPTPAYRSMCQANLKQIGLGFKQYIQDYNEKYPPTRNGAGAWGALIYPYVKSDQVFQCPADKTGDALKSTDYFYNARLAGVEEGKLEDFACTILMGDGTPDQPLDDHLTQLPATWRTDQTSPARRHLDGAEYLFAEGHVKWFKPAQVTLGKPSQGAPTFLIR